MLLLVSCAVYFNLYHFDGHLVPLRILARSSVDMAFRPEDKGRAPKCTCVCMFLQKWNGACECNAVLQDGDGSSNTQKLRLEVGRRRFPGGSKPAMV